MSIRYTLRHNIPSAKVDAEDVNDSSTWDLNLLRKHELAETDDHRVVYRKHNGEIVDWGKIASEQAMEIRNECQEIKNDVYAFQDTVQDMLDTARDEMGDIIQDLDDEIAQVYANIDIKTEQISNLIEDSQEEVNSIIEQAQGAIEALEDAIDIESITDEEIDDMYS